MKLTRKDLRLLLEKHARQSGREKEWEWEQRRRVIRQDETDLVREISASGCEIESVFDLISTDSHPVLELGFAGSYAAAYPVLVRHLSLPHHPVIREGIIRALTVSDGGRSVEEALLVEFQREEDPLLLWTVANALGAAMPLHRRRRYPTIAQVYRNGGGA